MTVAAELIKEARRVAGFTQAELARRAHTSQPTIAAYESGSKTPSVSTLDRLLRASGVQLRTIPFPPAQRPPIPLQRVLHERRDEILALAEKHHAANVRVFGSVARGEAGHGSDLDFLVDMEPGHSLLDQVRLRRALGDLLSIEVDLLTTSGLLKSDVRILEEAIPL
ncbi:MAG: helix-turn-helix domain-containing protein [Actinomycetota bacterium]